MKLTLPAGIQHHFCGDHFRDQFNNPIYSIHVAQKTFNYTLRFSLTHGKDKDEPNNRQGAVNKIKCSDFQTSYIGETGGSLHTTLTEQKRVKRNIDANNHITVHHHSTEKFKVQLLSKTTLESLEH